MKHVMVAALAAMAFAATGCARADALDDAIAAGNAMNKTVEVCRDYAKTHNDLKIPECNGSKQKAAYLDAKSKVRNSSPALEAIDEKNRILTAEVLSLMFKKK